MRRTLTTAILTLAILTPGAAAFADSPAGNASCNNMKGGNGADFNNHGGPAMLDSSGRGVLGAARAPVPHSR